MQISLFLVVLLAVFGFYLYQKNSNKPWKNLLGGLLILGGAFIICPLPDFSDTIGFTIFSAVKGIELNIDNFAVYFLEYTLVTWALGLIFVFSGMKLLHWNFKKLWKKLDIGKYKIAVGLSVLVVAIIAYLDIQGMIYWGSFSSVEAYTSGLQGVAFWNFFKTIAFSIMIIIPTVYYFLVHKDKSETLALFLASFTMWMFGFADILYFIFQKLPIPAVLSHLNNHPVIGWISLNILGYPQVTNIALLVSVFIGFIIVFFMTKILKEKF